MTTKKKARDLFLDFYMKEFFILGCNLNEIFVPEYSRKIK
jgi:hypothetical protein